MKKMNARDRELRFVRPKLSANQMPYLIVNAGRNAPKHACAEIEAECNASGLGCLMIHHPFTATGVFDERR